MGGNIRKVCEPQLRYVIEHYLQRIAPTLVACTIRQVVLDRYFSVVVLFLRAQFCHDLPASGCTEPLARTKAVGSYWPR
jgi:hypothetical protein